MSSVASHVEAHQDRYLEQLKELLSIPSVSTDPEKASEVRRAAQWVHDRLKAAGLTPLDVEQAIDRENATLPGGNVKSGFSDLYVRALGEYQTVDEIARTVITTVDGLPIRVRDVARVEDDY